MKEIKIFLRKVNTTDLYFLFKIYNESVKKKFFKSSKLVDLKNHKKWFYNEIKSKKSSIFIGIKKNNKKKIGYVRFNMINKKSWEISIANSPDFRSKGYGTLMLKNSIKKFRLNKKVKLISVVKKNNLRSEKCFLKNSFKKKIAKSYFLKNKISLYKYNYLELN